MRNGIDLGDYKENMFFREEVPAKIISELSQRFLDTLPVEVYGNLSVLQPSVGCFNLCSFCSQESGSSVRYLEGVAIRAIIEALNEAARSAGVPRLSCDKAYKPGVIFPYLDNDPGVYPYLDEYIEAIGQKGLRVRLSTAGWPRANSTLNKMHMRIASTLPRYLSAVRFSLNCFQVGMRKNRENYIEDFVSAANTYRSLFDRANETRALIDVCFEPDILAASVNISRAYDKTVISCGEYELVVSSTDLGCPSEAVQSIGNKRYSKGRFVPLKNEDGKYYAFLPEGGTSYEQGIYYYPASPSRNGGVLDARSPLAEMIHQNCFDNHSGESFLNGWDKYLSTETALSQRRGRYLQIKASPLVEALLAVFDELEIPFSRLLDGSVIRDRGMLRNAGRGFRYYGQLASGAGINVLCGLAHEAELEREVWRIFPVMRNEKQNQETAFRQGRKSYIESNEINCEGGVFLAVFAVDPATHSNYTKDGDVRRRFFVPIDDFTKNLICKDFQCGVESLQVPGLVSKEIRNENGGDQEVLGATQKETT